MFDPGDTLVELDDGHRRFALLKSKRLRSSLFDPRLMLPQRMQGFGNGDGLLLMALRGAGRSLCSIHLGFQAGLFFVETGLSGIELVDLQGELPGCAELADQGAGASQCRVGARPGFRIALPGFFPSGYP